jgi:hypothetical protein
MNKKVIFLSLAAILIVLPLLSLAAFSDTPTINNIEPVITSIINVIWQIFFGLSIVMFIIAGIDFLTARGDPVKIATAEKFVVWGVIGIVVAIIGFSIVTIVQKVLEPPPADQQQAQ